MSLKFGFGLYDDNPESRAFWTKKYKALSEEDKYFHRHHLCWILMVVDIGNVSMESIPHIVARYKLIERNSLEQYEEMAVERGAKDFSEYLERFTGYQVNVFTTTTQAFVKKLLDRDRRGYVNALPSLTKKQAENLPATDDILVDELPIEDLPLLAGRTWWISKRGAREKFQQRLAEAK